MRGPSLTHIWGRGNPHKGIQRGVVILTQIGGTGTPLTKEARGYSTVHKLYGRKSVLQIFKSFLLFIGTLSLFRDNKLLGIYKPLNIKVFSYVLLVDGAGSGSVKISYVFGSGRPKKLTNPEHWGQG